MLKRGGRGAAQIGVENKVNDQANDGGRVAACVTPCLNDRVPPTNPVVPSSGRRDLEQAFCCERGLKVEGL